MIEKNYMNRATGSVDKYSGWDYENDNGEIVNAVDLGEVVEVVSVGGSWVDMDAAVNLMDDEIREALHVELSPCGDQAFVDAYCEAHKAKYGEEFEVN